LILVAVALFAVLNWSVFSTPTKLNLVFVQIEASLGLLMLGVVAGLSVLYFLSVVWLETAFLLETKRFSREMEAQRRVADNAEASRFSEFRQQLDAKLDGLRTLASPSNESAQIVLTRVTALEATLRSEIDRAINTMSAYVGELEDRLERTGALPLGTLKG
jgi:hypothetical protein